MNDNNLINGWTISHGDYLRDPEYDDEFIKGKTKKKAVERAVFSISAFIALGSFIGIMSFVSSLIK